jgi:hypothetical protein
MDGVSSASAGGRSGSPTSAARTVRHQAREGFGSIGAETHPTWIVEELGASRTRAVDSWSTRRPVIGRTRESRGCLDHRRRRGRPKTDPDQAICCSPAGKQTCLNLLWEQEVVGSNPAAPIRCCLGTSCTGVSEHPSGSLAAGVPRCLRPTGGGSQLTWGRGPSGLEALV